MTSPADYLRSQVNVVTPPTEGELNVRGMGSIISLRGTTSNLESGPNWHHYMVSALWNLGFEGKIYIPCRLDADMNDCNEELTQQEKKNNERAFEASSVQIFYQPEYERPEVSLFVPFILEAERRARSGRTAYVLGAHNPKDLGLEGDIHFVVHQGFKKTAEAAYKALYPLGLPPIR